MLLPFFPPGFMVAVYTVTPYNHYIPYFLLVNLYLVVMLKINYIKCLPPVLMLICLRYFVVWASFSSRFLRKGWKEQHAPSSCIFIYNLSVTIWNIFILFFNYKFCPSHHLFFLGNYPLYLFTLVFFLAWYNSFISNSFLSFFFTIFLFH